MSYRNRPYRPARNRQSGFLAAGLLLAFAASATALYTAWGFTRVINATSQSQQLTATKLKMEELANNLADSANNTEGSVTAAPPTAATPGGSTRNSTSDITNIANNNSNVSSIAGYLPSGFTFKPKFGELRYIPFFHSTAAAGVPGVIPNGYVRDSGTGLPRPDALSFALVWSGVNKTFETTVNNLRAGVASGDDVVVSRTVEQVNGEAYRQMIEAASEIPNCGPSTNNPDVYETLSWDRANKKFICKASSIQPFAVVGNAQAISHCPPGMVLGITERDSDNKLLLACVPDIAPDNQSEFGAFMDSNGNIEALTDARLAYASPCADTAQMEWGLTNVLTAGQKSNIATNPASVTLNVRHRCVGTAAYTNTTTAGTRACRYDEMFAWTLDQKYTCVKMDVRNTAGFSSNFMSQWETAQSLREQNFLGNDKLYPFFANGRVFGSGVAGNYDLCSGSYRAAVSSKGLGCFLIDNPDLAAGRAQDLALQYQGTCPRGNILRATGNGTTNQVECIAPFKALAFAMPATSCPAHENGTAGALTWNANTQRFTCTFARNIVVNGGGNPGNGGGNIDGNVFD